jgi:hypothetical protein
MIILNVGTHLRGGWVGQTATSDAAMAKREIAEILPAIELLQFNPWASSLMTMVLQSS